MTATTETKNAALGAGSRRPALREGQREAIQRLRDNEQDEMSDLWVDPNKIPPGMTYEWKRMDQGYGKADTKYMARMERFGWTAVPASRHPEIWGKVNDPDTPGIWNGLMLMERPVELTKDARRHDYNKARSNVVEQGQKLRLSTQALMPRVVQAQKRSFEPVDIPADE